MLKLIGYWHGENDAAEWPEPNQFIRKGWETDDRSRIVDYLRSGVRVHEDTGYSYCRFPSGPRDEEMGNAELTDGVWSWPEALWVYVNRYSVMLPDEFILHVRIHGFKIPSDLDPAGLENEPVDFNFWRN